MDKITLKAQEREVLGKKVKNLRREGIIPAHVFGKKINTEHVSVSAADFSKVFAEAGESGLIDLKIGDSKIRPVLVRDVQFDPVHGKPLHIDFYQVNLTEKVKVTVPIMTVGEEPESVHAGETIIIQPMNEVEVEALPADLPENIKVDITPLQKLDDAIAVSQLKVPAGVEVLADPEAVVVKLDSAVSAEAAELMEEMQEEAAAAEAAEAPTESAEGEAPAEGETGETTGGEAPTGEETKEETAS